MMQHVFLVLLLSLLFICENLFAIFISGLESFHGYILIPHFLLFALLFIAAYNNITYAMIYSVIFGALFDIVYTEVLGVYVFAYFVIVYGFKYVMRYLQGNLVIVSFLSLFCICILEVYVYGLLNLFGNINMDFSYFWSHRVIPTLLLNSLFIIIFCFPLQKFLVRLKVDFNENKRI